MTQRPPGGRPEGMGFGRECDAMPGAFKSSRDTAAGRSLAGHCPCWTLLDIAADIVIAGVPGLAGLLDRLARVQIYQDSLSIDVIYSIRGL